MPGLNPFSLIPADFQQQMFNAVIDFLSDQAQKVLGDEVSARLKGLRSDAAFSRRFEAGLKRASERFVKEYDLQDEDLTAAVAADPTIFKNAEIQAALLWMLRHPGTDLDQQRAVVAQSFETVLATRKNRERVDRAVMFLLKCLTEELWTLPELQPIYSLQFQRMTTEAIRQQVELQKAQLQAQLELNTGLREALLQLTDALGERKLLTTGDRLALPELQVLQNLPQPDHGRFVGREDEIKQILRILRPYPYSQHSIVTIDGIGGIGKSALALEVAHRYRRNYALIPPDERFDAIIWTSAKRNTLTAEGIVPRQQALRTLDDIYTTIGITLQREGITRVRPEEQAETVRSALTRQRTLLIVDNLETVDDKAVMEFLRELPAPTKAIVTTRHRIDVAYPVRLTGMAWSDAVQLIEDECAKKQVDLSVDNQRRLYERTGGVPLALTWSIAQMGFGHSVEAVLMRLGQPNNDVARFCFEDVVRRLAGQPAHQLLMALSLFVTSASRAALGHVVDLAEMDRDDGLAALEKLSLVNKDGDRFQMLPLTQLYSRAELSQRPDVEAQFRQRWAAYFITLASRPRAERLETNAHQELRNLLSAIDWCWQHQQTQELMLPILTAGMYLWQLGDAKAVMHYYDIGLQIVEQTRDDLMRAYIFRRLADIKDFQNDLHEGLKLAQEAVSIHYRHTGDNNNKGLVLSLFRLANLQRILGNLAEARKNAEEGLRIAATLLEPDVFLIRCHCRMALIDLDAGEYAAANQHLDDAARIDENAVPRVREAWLSAFIYRIQGMLNLRLKQYPPAEAALREGLRILDDQMKSQRNVMVDLQEYSELNRYLAVAKQALGHTGEARDLAQKALSMFERLGMKRHLHEVTQFIGQLDTARENT